jgi:hypothetical protein
MRRRVERMGFNETIEELQRVAALVNGDLDKPEFRDAAMAFAIAGLGEIAYGPSKTVDALEALKAPLVRIADALDRLAPIPSKDLAGNPLPPMQTHTEVMLERIAKAFDHFNERKFHTD